MAQATSPPKRTNCPNCGAKLPEQPLSLCSYCAMPLDLADGVESQESKNTARIQKIPGGKGYEEAMAADPPESGTWFRGWRMTYQGKTLLILAGLALVLGLVLGNGTIALRPPMLLGYVLLIVGILKIVKGGAMCREAVQGKLLKRPALILDRRSDTTVRGWGGDTRYFFTIEFEDGGIAEFGMDGRGTSEEPFPNGMFGIAYTRGTELLEFKQIRV